MRVCVSLRGSGSFLKRIFEYFAAGILCLAGAAERFAVCQTLALSSGAASSGGAVSLNLTLGTGANLRTGMQWSLTYPEAVRILSVTAGPALAAAGKTLQCNSWAGAYSCVAYGLNTTTIPDGVVVVITASASQLAAIGVSSVLSVSAAGTALPLAGSGGTITVVSSGQSSIPTITSLACNSTSLSRIQPALCSVVLSAPTASAVTVALSSSNGVLGVPPLLTIPAGAQSLQFIVAYGGTAGGFATLTASVGTNSSKSISFTLDGSAPPLISAVTASAVSASAAAISWNTDTNADSQVEYGTTTAYGWASPYLASLVTTHAISLSGLTASTTYYYRVLSRDNQGRLGQAGPFTFTTKTASDTPVLLQLHGDASEVSDTANGSTITPGVAPAGFTGKVVVNGKGSVNFAPAHDGDGVYFLQCCGNTGNAYYRFTGASIGNLFDVNQGEVSFYLKSRYSFAQRLAKSSFRTVFDVRDDNMANHLFNFLIQTMSGRLVFSYAVSGTPQFYYVPIGTEDSIYGKDVVLKVRIRWTQGVAKLYLNDVLVQTGSFAKATPAWTAASNLDLGATEYLTLGGYNSLDDVVDEFTVGR
jgi:hypothetical protein